MGLEFSFDLDFGALDDRMAAAKPDAVRAGLEHIAEVSAGETPVEEGTLVRSQKVEVDEDGSGGSISYNTPYAIYVHEILKAKHPHGNAKFLERPLLAEAETAKQIIAQKLGQAL